MEGQSIKLENTNVELLSLVAPFDESIIEFKEKGYRLMSVEESAKLILQEGENSPIYKNSGRVKEGIIYIPGEGRFLTKNSPVLENPEEATDSHRNLKNFYIEENQMVKALENSVKVPWEKNSFPTNRFNEEETTTFLFGELTKDYGLFLKDLGIKKMTLWSTEKRFVENRDKPFSNQLWFANSKEECIVGGHGRELHTKAPIIGISNE